MSQELISYNGDLNRLCEEGYDFSIKDDHLIIRNIHYVISSSKVRFRTLVSR